MKLIKKFKFQLFYLMLLGIILFLSGCAGKSFMDETDSQSQTNLQTDINIQDETSSLDGESSLLTVIYTTDAHGHIVTDEETIGLDVISALKKNTPNSILVDCGDFIQGKPIASLTKGKDVVQLMKQAGYFATAVGNHEFDYSLDILIERAAEAASEPNVMHMLSANVKTKQGEDLLKPWVTTEVNGIKVGFFGITTEETVLIADLEVVFDLIFEKEINAAKEAVKSLQVEKCDVIIALTHVGTDENTVIKSTDIASEVEGIDVIIDGHSHVIMDKKSENGTILVSSGEHGHNVGVLDIIYNTTRKEVIEINNTLLGIDDISYIVPDIDVTKTVEQIQRDQEAVN